MQVVIEISETLKKIADEEDIKTFSHFMWLAIVMDAIKNGTPLPKGHGRLIDADSLDIPVNIRDGFEAMAYIDGVDTIIEADRSEEER